MKVWNWAWTAAKNLSEQPPTLDLLISYENIYMINLRAAGERGSLSEREWMFEPDENIYLPFVIQHQSAEHPERCLREDPQSHNKRHRRRGQVLG